MNKQLSFFFYSRKIKREIFPTLFSLVHLIHVFNYTINIFHSTQRWERQENFHVHLIVCSFYSPAVVYFTNVFIFVHLIRLAHPSQSHFLALSLTPSRTDTYTFLLKAKQMYVTTVPCHSHYAGVLQIIN